MKHSFIYPRDKADLDRALQVLDKPHRIDIKPYRTSRTLAQNSLLHIWMREYSQKHAEFYGLWVSADTWKEFFKDEFLLVDTVLLNGQIHKVISDTSDLSVDEFAHFLEQIDLYAATQNEIYLTRPADYHTAMGTPTQ